MVTSEIMTEDPVVGHPNWTVRRALRELHEGDFRHLPIVEEEGGELRGIISDRDLQAQMTPMMLTAGNEEEARELLDRPVSEIMRGGVISAYPEEEIDEVIEKMLTHRVGALPVVDVSTGDLRGIISYVDVLRAAQDLF